MVFWRSLPEIVLERTATCPPRLLLYSRMHVCSNSAVPLGYLAHRQRAPGVADRFRAGAGPPLHEQREKMSSLKWNMNCIALREVNMNCIALRRPVQTVAEAEVSLAKTKAFKDGLSKLSDTIVSSLVVVNVVSPSKSATGVSPSKSATESPAKAAADPEFDFGEALMCYECEPSPTAQPTVSRKTSWSIDCRSIAA